MNFIFVWLVFLLLGPTEVFLQADTDKVTGVSHILGRTIRLDDLCDDFENPNWKYDHQKHISSNAFWWGPDGLKGSHASNRGDPAILETIPTPPNGKSGSRRALKIGTNIPDDDNISTQDDFHTIAHERRLRHKLSRANQPVFVVYVWLPPFDQWGEYYSFAFRHGSSLENGSTYTNYSSIWLTYNKQNGSKPFFKYRSGTDKLYYEVYDPRPVEQDGWWTLAVAFDENGFDHYYAHPGVGAITEEDKLFNVTQLFYDVADPRHVEQTGWWTLVVAFDEESKCRYVCEYAGVGVISVKQAYFWSKIDEKGNRQNYDKYPEAGFPADIDKKFDATHLITKYGRDALLIKYINQSFFSLAYDPEKSSTNLRFVIDDYEAWIVKDK